MKDFVLILIAYFVVGGVIALPATLLLLLVLDMSFFKIYIITTVIASGIILLK